MSLRSSSDRLPLAKQFMINCLRMSSRFWWMYRPLLRSCFTELCPLLAFLRWWKWHLLSTSGFFGDGNGGRANLIGFWLICGNARDCARLWLLGWDKLRGFEGGDAGLNVFIPFGCTAWTGFKGGIFTSPEGPLFNVILRFCCLWLFKRDRRFKISPSRLLRFVD